MYELKVVERAFSALNSPEKCLTLAILDQSAQHGLHTDTIRDRYNALHGRSSQQSEYRSATDIDRWIGYSLIPCGLVEESGFNDSRRLAFARALITTPQLPVQQNKLERDILALGESYAGGFDRTMTILDQTGTIVYSSGRREAIEEMQLEGRDGRKEFVKYRLGTSREIGEETLNKGLVEDILLYFEVNPEEELRVSEIADKLIQNFDKYKYYGESEEAKLTLNERLRNLLPMMANLRILSKSKYHGLYQSELNLTDFGRGLFGRLIQILDITASGDTNFLNEGRQILEEILPNQRKIIEYLARRR
jgi:hypothetical protein